MNRETSAQDIRLGIEDTGSDNPGYDLTPKGSQEEISQNDQPDYVYDTEQAEGDEDRDSSGNCNTLYAVVGSRKTYYPPVDGNEQRDDEDKDDKYEIVGDSEQGLANDNLGHVQKGNEAGAVNEDLPDDSDAVKAKDSKVAILRSQKYNSLSVSYKGHKYDGLSGMSSDEEGHGDAPPVPRRNRRFRDTAIGKRVSSIYDSRHKRVSFFACSICTRCVLCSVLTVVAMVVLVLVIGVALCLLGVCSRDSPKSCGGDVCKNGGSCVESENSTSFSVYSTKSCLCIAGYSGRFCDTNIDDCQEEPCYNGTCVDLIDDYQCNCFPGYTGRSCSIDKDECATLPCKNGATCIDLIDGFTCQCPKGLTGLLCEQDVDDCDSDPCLNGGQCRDTGIHNFTCICEENYGGYVCEIDLKVPTIDVFPYTGTAYSFSVTHVAGPSYTVSSTFRRVLFTRTIESDGYADPQNLIRIPNPGGSLSQKEIYLFSQSAGLAKKAPLTYRVSGSFNVGLSRESTSHTASEVMAKDWISDISPGTRLDATFKGTLYDNSTYLMTSLSGVSLTGTMNPVVAFTASNVNAHSSPGPVIFNNLYLNSGKAFNMSSQQFIVPVFGLYLFTISSAVPASKDQTLVLRVNGVVRGGIIRDHADHNGKDVLSRNILLRLYPQDKVKLYLISGSIAASNDLQSVSLSGFLYSPVNQTERAWSVYRTKAWEAKNVSKAETLKFDSVEINVGQMFDRATSVINIDVSGVYYVSWSARVGAGRKIYTQIRHNDVNNGTLSRFLPWNTGDDTISRSLLLHAEAGSNITVWTDSCRDDVCYVGGDAIYKTTAFIGFLVYPD